MTRSEAAIPKIEFALHVLPGVVLRDIFLNKENKNEKYEQHGVKIRHSSWFAHR